MDKPTDDAFARPKSSDKPIFTALDLGIEALLEEGRGATFGAVTRTLQERAPTDETVAANKQDPKVKFQESSANLLTVVPFNNASSSTGDSFTGYSALAPYSVQIERQRQSGESSPDWNFHTGRDFFTYKNQTGDLLGFEAVTNFRHHNYFSWFGLFESYQQHIKRQQFDASGALWRRSELDCKFYGMQDLRADCRGKVFDAQGKLISQQESQYYDDGRVRVKVADGQNIPIGFVLADKNSVKTSMF